MKHKKLQEKLLIHFPFTPTKQQEQLISDLANYITTLGNKSIFLLKWYAGTGKTTRVKNKPLFYIYDDGKIDKQIILE